MKIQPINQQTDNNIGFQKLIVKKGSFNVLKNSKYFPDKSYPDYYNNLKSFCEKVIELRKECEQNELYNVVVRPNSKELKGGIYIENADGVKQYGFFKSFEDIFDLEVKKQQKLLTKKQDPNFLNRLLKNWEIKRYNKKVAKNKVSMQEFLTSVFKHLKEMANNADYLTELHNIKKNKKKEFLC